MILLSDPRFIVSRRPIGVARFCVMVFSRREHLFADCITSHIVTRYHELKPNPLTKWRDNAVQSPLSPNQLLALTSYEAPKLPELSPLGQKRESKAYHKLSSMSWSFLDSSDFSRVEPIPKDPNSPFRHIEEL